MRIIAGEYRSRKIETRSGNETRPTLDKVREAVFSSLGGMFDGGTVLDLYAGSGANGLEALSRGYDYAVFADISKDAINIIRKNIESLRCQEKTKIFHMPDKKVLSLLKAEGLRFDLVYLDPPYAGQHNDEILEYLQENNMITDRGVVVIESAKKDEFKKEFGSLKPYKEATYGITRITYYRNEVEG